jgi:RimJ/RimL family protein N-acetyltransferase
VGVTPAPRRIETDRLVIRCYELADAPLLKEAIDSSLDHLRPWMPWVQYEPQTLAQKTDLIRGFRDQFDAEENFVYGVFDPGETRIVGGSGLHPRGPEESLEIGYWIRADEIGRGLATELTAALTRVGFEVCRLQRVDVKVDPENVRSARVPRKVGYTDEVILRRELPPKVEGGERRDAILFTMVRDELAGSPAAKVAYRAFDAAGNPV